MKIVYWITTILISAIMCMSAYMYITNSEVAAGFTHLGFTQPSFRIELAVFKIIGVLILLIPNLGRLKEWAYAGFTIVFVSAFIAHTSAGDPISKQMGPVIALVVLLISYYTYHRGYVTAKGKVA